MGRTADFPVGSQVTVVYDPANPSHAKPVEGWSASHDTVTIWAVMILSLGVVNSVLRTVRTVLLLRTVNGGPDERTAMWAESFLMTRWWQRWPRQWVALWPFAADPRTVDARLYAPIEDLARSTAIGIEQPSTVLGVPRPGQLLVVIHDDRVVWPRGRARSGPPKGSLVDGDVQGQIASASWGSP